MSYTLALIIFVVFMSCVIWLDRDMKKKSG